MGKIQRMNPHVCQSPQICFMAEKVERFKERLLTPAMLYGSECWQ